MDKHESLEPGPRGPDFGVCITQLRAGPHPFEPHGRDIAVARRSLLFA